MDANSSSSSMLQRQRHNDPIWRCCGRLAVAIAAFGCLYVMATLPVATAAPAAAQLVARDEIESFEVSPFSNFTERVTEIQHDGNDGRFLVMGDIHGCLDEFNELVNKMQYQQGRDRLVLLGDLTDKGPDSLGVVRRARELGAMCVRGNHDDKVIRIASYLRSHGGRSGDGDTQHASKDEEDEEEKKGKALPEGHVHDDIKWTNHHFGIAEQLDDEDYEYLQQCSLIMSLPDRHSILVHAGLDPNIKSLDEQDPYYVMNMRSLDKDGHPVKHKKDGKMRWFDAWNEYGPSEKVYYAHAASSGLQINGRTYGIDTGCVYGGQLTALDIDTHKLYQIQCPQYTEHD